MVERGILFDEAVGEFEKRFIKRVLDRTNGNQSRAAEVLGIHRNTLSRKISEYKLDHRARAAKRRLACSAVRLRSKYLDAAKENGPEFPEGRFRSFSLD